MDHNGPKEVFQKQKLCVVQGLNWDKLRCFSSTGEASSPEDYHWLAAMAGYKPVIEYCGGTEIGGGFLGGTMVQPQAPSHFSTPTIGCRVALLDEQTVLYDSLQGAHTREHLVRLAACLTSSSLAVASKHSGLCFTGCIVPVAVLLTYLHGCSAVLLLSPHMTSFNVCP